MSGDHVRPYQVVIGLLILLGCGGAGMMFEAPSEQLPEARRRVKLLGNALRLYASDNDGWFPNPADSWASEIFPYLNSDEPYRSPAFDGTEHYGFAFNALLAGRGEFELGDQGDLLLAFDSKNLKRAAVASIETLPSPGRYGGKNAVLFADGYQEESPSLELARTRLKTLAVSSFIYSADYDDLFFPVDNWHERLSPYIRSTRPLKSPIFDETEHFGFAVNSQISGTHWSQWPTPADTPLFFDSTELGPSAASTTFSMPDPVRYDGGNGIVYLDGTARRVSAKGRKGR